MDTLRLEIGVSRAAIDGREVTSFVASTRPMADESLVGYIARIASLNAFSSVPHALQKAGLYAARPGAVPVVHLAAAPRLAFVFKTGEVDVRHRMYADASSGRAPERIAFFGVPIRPSHREGRIRRVAPGGLRDNPYHRAVWELRPLAFDPDTLEWLIDSCPRCRRRLGWSRTLGPPFCERCADARGAPLVDLRDIPPSFVEVEDEAALRVAGLLAHPLGAKRARARSELPAPFDHVPDGDLFELAVTLACLLAAGPETTRGAVSRMRTYDEYRVITPGLLAEAGRILLDWPGGFHTLADRVRLGATHRRGGYGAKKELAPLLALTWDRHFSPEMREVLRAAVTADLTRAAERAPIARRRENRPRADLLTAQEVEHRYAVPRRLLGRLKGRSDMTTIRGGTACTAPLLFVDAEIRSVAEERADAESAASAAARIGVPAGALADLARRELIPAVTGPALALTPWAEAYRRSGVDALCSAISGRVVRGRQLPATVVSIDLALQRLRVVPAPWSAVIAAILDGRLPVYRRGRRGSPLLKRLALTSAADLGAALGHSPEAARAELHGTGETPLSREAAAWLLGVSSAYVGNLVAAGLLGSRTSQGTFLTGHDVDAFRSAYAPTTEIARRLAVAPRLASTTMARAGFRPHLVLEPRGRQVWLRRDAEAVIANLADSAGARSGVSPTQDSDVPCR